MGIPADHLRSTWYMGSKSVVVLVVGALCVFLPRRLSLSSCRPIEGPLRAGFRAWRAILREIKGRTRNVGCSTRRPSSHTCCRGVPRFFAGGQLELLDVLGREER